MNNNRYSRNPPKRVTFVLPGSSGSPSGGTRIVYEYANRLSRKGYQVCVVQAPVNRVDPDWQMITKALVRYPQRLVDRSYRPDQWISVEPEVEVRWTPTLAARFVPDGDVVIATAWKTAEWVANYPQNKGRKFYFVQHYEDWDAPSARIDATWQLPMKKIVIARWLQDIAFGMDESASYVPNGIDCDVFYKRIAPCDRKPHRLVMLYHSHPWKGSSEGLRAIEDLKKENPKLEAALFGTPSRPEDIPSWIEYYRNPKQEQLREIYNQAAVFLAPSHKEGWGLPALEAMACGAGVVATDNAGHLEFAVHGENSLLVRPGDWRAMSKTLKTLIEDNELRVRLSSKGVDTAKKLSWENSVNLFEHAIFDDAGK